MFRGPAPPPDLSTVAVATSGEPELDLKARTTTRRIAIGTGSGFVGGAATGAALTVGGTFVCAAILIPTVIGPLFCIAAGVVAFPFMVGGGAIIGTVGGATTGAIVGGLPGDTATEISELTHQPASVRDFTQELGTAVRTNIPESRQTERREALTLVALELTRVELAQYRSDKLSIKMQAEAKYSWGGGGHRRSKRKATATCKYEYETEPAHVSEWLPDGGRTFDQAFTNGIDAIARQISVDMDSSLPPPEKQGRRFFGAKMTKLGENTYEVTHDTAQEAEERRRSICWESLRDAR
jgi:hypothetical protein